MRPYNRNPVGFYILKICTLELLIVEMVVASRRELNLLDGHDFSALPQALSTLMTYVIHYTVYIIHSRMNGKKTQTHYTLHSIPSDDAN